MNSSARNSSQAGTVLVTGGAGYVGSHACKALATAGFTPVTYDNLAFGHESAVKWGPYEHGDILDAARLADVMRNYRPKAVFHFAAFAYVGESVVDPAKYYRNNVLGTQSLLDVMRSEGINQIVFSSSCAVYGVPETIPISEDAPLNPINPYGASKAIVERMLADYGSAYGLRSVALRYFNAAGADPDSEIGEDHQPETHIIPLAIEAAIGARPDVTIYGSDYETADGTCIRDFVHVGDIADAHVLALTKLKTNSVRQAYNLGAGRGVSVKEVIDKVQAVTGRNVSVVKGPRRAGDPPILFANPRRAMEELNWQPQFASIEEIIESAWKWHAQLRGISQSGGVGAKEKGHATL